MNLLCPNCQKMLTVSEQYAGQLMKCPLCNGTFTVPTLPPAVPPPPPPEIFSFKDNEPAALPPPSLTQPSTTATTKEPSAPPPPPPPLPPGEYTRKATIWFSPKVIPFIPAAAIILVFFLQLLPWVGFYLGNYAVVSQNAWGAAFASQPAEENDYRGLFRWTTEKDVKDEKEPKVPFIAYPPSWSPLTVLYLVLYFLAAAPLTLACVVLPFVHAKLPPAVQPFLRWKWMAAFVFNLLVFAVLLLQLAVGFGLETGVKSAETARQQVRAKAHEDMPLPEKQMNAAISDADSRVQITYFLDLVILLHLLIVVCALLMFWLNQRETFNKPLPELSLRW